MQIMANSIVRKIVGTVKDVRYYSVIVDKVTNSLNREQVTICLHCIDEKFDADRDFIGLHIVESIGPNVLVGALTDV